MMCELGLVIKPINFTTILRHGGEGDNVIQVKSQHRVDIVNKCLHILIGALIEGNDCKSRTMTAEALGYSLVVFNCGATIAEVVTTA